MPNKKFHLVLVSMILLVALGSSSSAQTAFTRKVDSKNPFDTSLGIPVLKDQEIEISASGKWTTMLGTWEYVDADGYPPSHPSSQKGYIFHLQAKIGSSLITVGKYKKFKSPANGTLLLGHDDPSRGWGDNAGSLTITVNIITTSTVMIPGVPADPTLSGTRFDGISGLSVISEDQQYTWTGLGVTEVTLAPGSMIDYTFTFGDQYDTTAASGSFDPFSVSNIAQNIKGSHIYKESGSSYDIFLEVRFTKRVYLSSTLYNDSRVTHVAGPFRVIVVDHLPEYIGNLFFFIMGPKNTTDRKPPPGIKDFDLIYEDPDPVDTRFYISAIINLYTELPPATNTGVDPDRFSGIEPTSVKYRIDFGDDSPVTQWFPFEEVNKSKPQTLQESMSKSLFESPHWTHDYKEPGEYSMKVTIVYQEVKYQSISNSGVAYTYQKIITPPQYMTMTKKIIVADRTPPRISSETMADLNGFTGDPLALEFVVEDNNTHTPLKNASILIEKHDERGQYDASPLTIEEVGVSESVGKVYKLSGSVTMPDVFAHKSGTSTVPLDYLLEITDGEGNVNQSNVRIQENQPPFYGAKNSLGVPEPAFPGKLFIQDNDPPGATVRIMFKDRCLAGLTLEEDTADSLNPTAPGNADLRLVCNSTPVTVADPESNPRNSVHGLSGVEFKEVIGEVPEDNRLIFQVSSTDNVDSEAANITLECNQTVNSFNTGQGNCHFIFPNSGPQELNLTLWDKPNLDGSFCGRKVRFLFHVQDSKIIHHTLGGQK